MAKGPKKPANVIPFAVAEQIAEAERQRAAAGAVAERWQPDDDGHNWPDGDSDGEVGNPDTLDGRLAFYPLTDLGNAERFRERHRGRLIHVAAIGWFVWDGRRWARERAEAIVARAAHETVRAIQTEAKAIRGTALDIVLAEKKTGPVMLSDKVAAWGRASESAQRLQATARIAAAYLEVEADKLDADPWAINVLNGTLRIDRTGGDGDFVRFGPHDPADLITKLAPVTFDPATTCPVYDRFLADVQPLPEVRRFLHQWGGYSLVGDTGEQKLAFFYGKGRNGKSTLVDAWGAIAGDYGETVPIETFLDQGRGRNAGQATPDLAILPGVRFLRTSEPERGAKLAESLIKLTTGGEPIQARHLNRDYFKFRPAFKLTLSGNYRPSITGTDEGIWRRVVLVPWPVKVETPDLHLLDKLRGETSGILNRLLDGLRDYLDQGGLSVPETVSQATAEYREDSDPLGRFLEACVAGEIGSRVQATAMHRMFIAWARANSASEWSARGLAMALKERGYTSVRSNGMHWQDVRLTCFESDFADPATPFQEGGG